MAAVEKATPEEPLEVAAVKSQRRGWGFWVSDYASFGSNSRSYVGAMLIILP